MKNLLFSLALACFLTVGCSTNRGTSQPAQDTGRAVRTTPSSTLTSEGKLPDPADIKPKESTRTVIYPLKQYTIEERETGFVGGSLMLGAGPKCGWIHFSEVRSASYRGKSVLYVQANNTCRRMGGPYGIVAGYQASQRYRMHDREFRSTWTWTMRVDTIVENKEQTEITKLLRATGLQGPITFWD